jgi:hypothetical protein
MTKTDLYAVAFHSWLQPLSIDLARFGIGAQDLGSIVHGFAGGISAASARLAGGALLVAMLLLIILRSADFRRSFDHLLGGLIVGLCVVGGWYLTGGPWGRQWLEAAEWLDQPPLGVGVQSYTFVNPAGETLSYLARPAELGLLTFGVVAVSGVLLGALTYSILSRQFRLEWFSSWADFLRHVAGGALMGVGGVLAMGCTVGQGITGISTLAAGSFLALGAIVLGSATTMKILYYKMLYEDASLFDAWLSGWVDLHLLPRWLRRLEAL